MATPLPEGATAPKRGRGRPPVVRPAFANLSDDAVRSQIHACAEAKTVADSATGKYRSAIKTAKNMGIPAEAITWYLAAKGRDPKEIDRETEQRNKVARIMGLPIGTQLGLFQDGTTVATATENDKAAKEDQKADAFEAIAKQGYDDYGIGRTPTDAMKEYEDGSPKFLKWMSGWNNRKAEEGKKIEEGLAPKKGHSKPTLVN